MAAEEMLLLLNLDSARNTVCGAAVKITAAACGAATTADSAADHFASAHRSGAAAAALAL